MPRNPPDSEPPRLKTTRGALPLRRYPQRPNESLLAWCAADSLLIDRVLEDGQITGEAATLVVNDEHGALALALGAQCSWTDSSLSALALAANCKLNDTETIPVTFSTASPPAAARVVMRVPKQLAFFEYQLATLAATQPVGTPLLVGGMDKHLSPHTAEIMERYAGPTERHRGRRKARLFSATLGTYSGDYPKWERYFCAPLKAELAALPNVFSRDRLDGGSELLIAQLGKLPTVTRLTDLACGNGVLGLAALQAGLSQRVLFCDESAMAIRSAETNLQALLPERRPQCAFFHGDGLKNYLGENADLVLCNPPFHLQHTVDDFAGRRLLTQGARHLTPEGKLCLVANRHLRYRPALERLFRRVEPLAQNNKFVVWLASQLRAIR